MAKARKLSEYQLFTKKRIPELRASGVANEDIMATVGAEWRALKGGAPVAKNEKRETRVTGGLRSLKAEIPLVVEANPDLAAVWDMAEGVLDYLIEHNAERDSNENAARRAASMFARAKGDSSTADQVEHDIGFAIGEVLVLAAVHRGMSKADWEALAPPELGGGGGLLSNVAEGLLGLAGISADLDESGAQSGIVGAVAGAAGDSVLSLFDN